jgi:ribose transport system substrate-binding protein
MKLTGTVRSSAVAAALVTLVVAGCGSSDSTSTSASTSSATSTAAGASGGIDQAAAGKILAPYEGKPSAFPVDEPLPRPLPAGTKLGFLQCVTPICGIFAQALAPAARTLGAQLDVVKAGASANDLQSAMSSLIEKHPAGLIIPGIEPATISGQLKQAGQAGIKLVANGIMGADRYGIEGQTLGEPAAQLSGKLMAAWVVDRKPKGDANVVFYNTPELSFSAPIKETFGTTMKQLCPSCSVRYVDIPVATIGNSAPNQVASDLQSHPDTDVMVFASAEASTGVPAALKTAGLTLDSIGFAPGPANLQDIKDGKMTAGLAVDVATTIWTLADEMARLLTDAPLTAGEKSTVPVMQIVSADDLDYDVSKGWSGYPDFAERFAKLWKAD